MDDDDWRNCSATTASAAAEASSADSWQIQWQETNRNFYQTVNKIRIQQGVPPVNHRFDPIGKLLNDRTIFVKIQNESYPISCEILDSIFSEFGILIRIERLSSGFHSTIHFFEKASTIRAFESLNGRNIYDGCCKLELFLATSMDSSSADRGSATLEEIEGASSSVENYNELETEEIANPSQEPELECSFRDFVKGGSQLSVDTLKVRNDEFELEQMEQQTPTLHQGTPVEISQAISANDFSSEIEGTGGEVTNFSKVTFESLNNGKNEVASLESVGSDETNCANHDNFNGMAMALTDFRIVAIECLGNSVAHKVFVEMSGPTESSFAIAAAVVKHRVQDGNSVFDPGIAQISIGLDKFLKTRVQASMKQVRIVSRFKFEGFDAQSFKVDDRISHVAYCGTDELFRTVICYTGRGTKVELMRSQIIILFHRVRVTAELVKAYWLIECILVFDPGGILAYAALRMSSTGIADSRSCFVGMGGRTIGQAACRSIFFYGIKCRNMGRQSTLSWSLIFCFPCDELVQVFPK